MDITPLSRRASRFAGILAVTALLGMQSTQASQLPTLATITIDGNFDDWSQVFVNPLQFSADGNASVTGGGCYPTNPDRDCPNINGTGRDITQFAWTYDNTNIYTYLSREKSTSSVMHYTFVMDVNADGIATNQDYVLDVQWNSGGNLLSSVTLYNFKPPTGQTSVPLDCQTASLCPAPGGIGYVDGYNMPGSFGAQKWQATNVPGGSPTGDKFEVYIPWNQLGPTAAGLAPGSPIFWHVAASTNGQFDGAVDNVGGPDGKLGSFGVFAFDITPAYEGSTASPGTLNYCHTFTNTGQFQDAYDYLATSSTGSGVAFYSDNGSCGPGTLIALDANGDGDFTDPGDSAPAAANDSNADGRPDTGTVAANATKKVVVQLRIPAGLNNVVDALNLRGTSIRQPSRVSAQVTDKTRIGSVTVSPDLWKAGQPSAQVTFGPYTITNNQGVADTFTYSLTSSHGWALQLYSDNAGAVGTLLGTDSNGDGSWDGATPNSGVVAAGGTLKFWIKAQIPAGATVGTNDAIAVKVQSTSLAQVRAQTSNTLAVMNALTLTPSYVTPDTALIGSAGSSVFLPHRVINAQAAQDTITLSISTAPAAGYTMRWLTDPNCDESPADGAPITGPFTLAAFGGTACIVTEIRIPATGGGAGSAAQTTATGLSQNASARDDVVIGNLQTFADSNLTLASRDFAACTTLYVRGVGLTGGTTTTYTVLFKNASNVTVATKTMATNPSGVGSASYTLAAADAPGAWTVELRQNSTTLIASLYPVNVERSGTAALTVPSSGSSGMNLGLSALVTNTSAAANYDGTSVLFTVKDPSNATFLTQTASNLSVLAGTSSVGNASFANVNYPAYGNYTITATWSTSCGSAIATDTKTMPVPPPAPVITAPSPNAAVSSTTPQITGTAESNGSVAVYLDGVLISTVSGPSFTVTPSVLSQGPHSVYAVQTVNGVSSVQSSTVSFTVDTGAPSSAITAPSANALFNTAPIAISGTASDATSSVSSVAISINGGAWITVSGTSSWSYAFTPSADGTYTVQSRATDAAGNLESPTSSRTFTYDTTAPETSITSGPSGSTSATSAAFAFSATETATFECSLDGAAFATCASGQSYSSLANGSHTFRVRATDAAGNVDATPASRTWTVDTVPPTVTFTSTPPSLDNSATPTFSFISNEPGSTFECSLDSGTFASCSSPSNLSGLADGSHTYRVRATDAAGNTGTATYTWTVDRTGPSVTLTSKPPSLTNSSSASFSFTSDPGVTFECKLDSGSFVPCSSPTAYASLSDGSHTFQARGTDAASNVGAPASWTWTVDTVAPNAPLLNAVASNTANPVVSGTAEPGSTVTIFIDGAAVGTTPADASGNFSFNASGLADGGHTIAATATDAANNTSSPATVAITTDTTPPTVQLTSAPPALTASASATFTFSSNEPGTFKCSLDGSAYVACPTPNTYSTLGDGPHSFSVKAVDAVGNESLTPATHTWTVDTTKPVVSFTSTPATETNLTSASFAFTASETATFSCSLDGAAFAACSSPHSLASLAEGDHTFAVKATDSAGNVSDPRSFTWTVDTTPPTVTFTSTPSSPTNSTSATLAFSVSETGASTVCSLDGAAFTACSSPVNLTGLADGSHSYRAQATDAAGNTGAIASFSWIVDTQAPASPFVSAIAANTPTPTVSGTAEAGALITVTIDGVIAGTATVDAAGNWTFDVIASLADGSHSFSVTATDAAGNESSPTVRTVVTDTVAPTVTITSTPPALTTSAAASFTFTSNEAGTFLCALDGAAFAACPDPASYSGLADGSHTFQVKAVDAAGNVSSPASYSWTVDTAAPNAPTLNAFARNDATPTLTGTAEPNSTVTISIDGTVVGTTTASASGDYSFTVPSAIADGSHDFSLTATDAPGNVSQPATRTVIIDTLAPVASFTSTPPAFSGSSSASFAFTANETATFECSLDGAAFTACVSPASLSGLGDGSHTYEVRATDSAGNLGSPASYTFTVDTQPPDTSFASTPPLVDSDTTPTFAFSATQTPATYECRLDSASTYSPCSNPVTLSALPDGSHTLSVRAKDAAGNVDPTPASYAWTVDTSLPDTLVVAGPASQTNQTTASFTFGSTASPATYECNLDGAGFQGCSETQAFPGLGAGAHTLLVRSINAANTVDPSPASWSWTVDLSAPIAPTIDPIAANTLTPPITGTAEPGSTVTIVIDGVTVGTATTDGSGNYTFTPSTPLSEGPHTVTVTATDPAGNTGPSATANVLTDITLPTVAITSTPANPTNQTSATFSFTSNESSATFLCSVDGSAFATCTSGQTWNGFAGGSHTFNVKAVDAATNQSAPASFTWTVDTVAPPQPTIDPIAANDPTPTITGTAEPGTTVTVVIDGTPVCTVTAAANGTFSCTPTTPLSDGPHDVTVTATDPAGNPSPPITVTVTTDTVLPVASITSKPTDPSNAKNGTFGVASSEANSTFLCKFDSAALSGCPANPGYVGLADGSHTFTVVAVDPAGNQSAPVSYTWTIDTGIPAAPSLDPISPQDNTPTISGTAEPLTTATIIIDGVTVGTAPVDATGHFTFDVPTTLADGTHTVQVTVTDAAGNTSPAATQTVSTDTLVPTVTITGKPAAFTNVTTATLTFTGSESGTFECSLDGAAFATCSSPSDYTTLADGAHTFSVKLTDGAGNVSAPASASWTVDTVAPAAPVLGTVSPSSNTPVISGTAEAGSTVTISIDGTVVGTATADGTGNFTFQVTTPIADATHAITATATDAAGNVSPPGSTSVITDTGLPTVSFSATPASLTNAQTGDFAFAANEPATLECSLDGAAFAGCTSPTTVTGLSDGVHSYAVRATDTAGNQGPPTSYSWTVDATPPDTTLTGNPGALEAVPDAAFAFSSEANATFECSLDGAAFTACTTPHPELGLADGSHSFAVRAKDAAGNVDPTPATFTWTVDTTPPDTTITLAPPSAIKDTTATFEFTSEANATFECSVDGAAFATCSSPLTLTGLADGQHTLEVRAKDTAGNVDPSPATSTFTVDTGAPDTTIVTGPASLTNKATADFTFESTEASSTFECRVDSGAFEACTTPFTLTNVTEGEHTLQVRATEVAGNVDPTPASWSWTVDLTPPDTVIDSGPAEVVKEASASFTFHATIADASLECSIDGDAFAPCTSPSDVTGLSDGAHEFRVRAVDSAGNADPTPAVWKWAVNPDLLLTNDVAIQGGGCGCNSTGGGGFLALFFGALFVFLKGRRRGAFPS